MRAAPPAVLLVLAALAGGCAPPPAEPPPSAHAPAPERPGEAATWAGIDVGSKGVKPVAMRFARTAGGWEFTADTTLESANTDLGTPADGGRTLDPGRLAATAAAVKRFDAALREKYALPPDRVRVAVSSGVFARFRDPAAADAARADVSAALAAATGRAPDFIDDRREAELAARGTIGPAARAGRALVDIGSGNIKFGWYAGGRFQNRTIGTGTKAFRDAAAARAAEAKLTFGAAAAALREPLLAAPLREVTTADGFAALTDVQMVGGAVWALATFTHPGAGAEPLVPLSAADAGRFAELVELDKPAARARVLGGAGGAPPAAAELDRVWAVFSPDELRAAATILQAAFAERRFAEKKVVFFTKGQHAWLAGYLMEAAKLPD